MYDVIGMDPVNGVGRIMLIVHGEFAERELRDSDHSRRRELI